MVYQLFSRNAWLVNMEEPLIELLSMSSNRRIKALIADMINRFVYIEQAQMAFYLDQIAKHIVSGIGYSENSTIISTLTMDDEGDSSLKFIDIIRPYLWENGWKKAQTLNRMNSIGSWHSKGRTDVVLFDEFTGTAKTAINRLNTLNNSLLKGKQFRVEICFLAGMENAVNLIRASGVNCFCPIVLKRGLSDAYSGKKLTNAFSDMSVLESMLAQNLGAKNFSEYSFGYGKAEALYSLDKRIGNIPNNVFPIFWWPKLLNNEDRRTLFTRFERELAS